MILYPALDLKQGQVLRYVRGLEEELHISHLSPLQAAQDYEKQGFKWLHVVDIDGAVQGEARNAEAIEEIVKNITIPVQIGGGIRDIKSIAAWLEKGVARVVVGTLAQKNPELVKEACRLFPQQVAVSIDARGGKVALAGWSEMTKMSAIDLAMRYEDAGAAAIIYTDIGRAGTVTGVNVEAMADLAFAITTPVIAAGGLADVRDIEALIQQETSGIIGLICGRALYDGRVNAAAALAAAGAQSEPVL